MNRKNLKKIDFKLSMLILLDIYLNISVNGL